MKAVLHFRASHGLRARLPALSPDWLSVVAVDEADLERFASEMRDADVLLHVLRPVTRDVIAGSPKLRLIQKIGTGLDTIDLAAAAARGVAVANMPGTNSQAVAEMTLALMLAALRRLVSLDRATRAGAGWSQPAEAFDATREIAGSTIGFVGFGEVPRRLVPALRALGAQVLYTALSAKPDAQAEWRSLPELLAASDIVSLHVPLTPETERLINRSTLALMRPGGILVNTGRGALVDEADLLAALRSGRLAAAGLDVLVTEPAAIGQPLLELDNLIVTPHVAWLTPQTLERSLRVAVENCARLARGDELLHRVV